MTFSPRMKKLTREFNLSTQIFARMFKDREGKNVTGIFSPGGGGGTARGGIMNEYTHTSCTFFHYYFIWL